MVSVPKIGEGLGAYMSDRPKALSDLGYAGPTTTECSRTIDRLLPGVMRNRAMDALSILEAVHALEDGIFVFETREILAESSDCFCAAWLRLKNGEVIMAVPWLAQYEQGACMSVYRRGTVDDLEVELILAQLFQQLEFLCTPNTQQYMQ